MKRLIYILLLLPVVGLGQAILVDSYTAGTPSDHTTYTGGYIYIGQSFTCTDAVILDSCKFALKKYKGSPTGSAYAQVYAHSGTYGTSSVPTGEALATSDAFDIASLTTSYQYIKFIFSGANKIILNGSTYYCIVFYNNNGNTANYVSVERASEGHSGNGFRSTDGITWGGTNDFHFYVYGKGIIKKIAGVLDANTKKVAGVADANIKKISGKTK
jgi:hypothetical protein